MSNSFRSKFDIIGDTLDAIKKVDKKAHLMSRANLNSEYHKKIISFLEENGFIEKNSNGNGKPYVVLEKGKKYQATLAMLKALLEPSKPYSSSA